MKKKNKCKCGNMKCEDSKRCSNCVKKGTNIRASRWK